ncbi:MAG TPA: HDOD domain-containing protein, partial [Tepidisphaeraceae bacterium]|nr:HDOD domain-containing protein [Tepidisphaeraceae bacterium]
MKKIMVVDDMAILRDPIAASLRLAGYQTSTAGDGREAIDKASAEIPDLVLLDLNMPGIDGLTVLRYFKADPRLTKIPVILLTAVSDKQSIIEAARLGIREYLLKTHFSLPELLNRLDRHLGSIKPAKTGKPISITKSVGPTSGSAASKPIHGSAPIPQLLDRDQCIARAQQALEGKTLSGVVAQVISQAASPRGDTRQISELIARDPLLSARILQAANSPAYASNKGIVANIPDAIRNVGFTTVRNIAAAMGIFDAMPETTPDGFNPIRCWQHSFAVAQICERLQSILDPEQAGVAYLVGLCHDLGEIL